MTIETVTIEYLNPREGNKPPSIKAGGKYYGVSDDDYEKFQKGASYSVNVISRHVDKGKYAGRTFYDITAIVGSAASPSAATGPAVAANGHAAPAYDAEARKSEQIWCTAHTKKIVATFYDPEFGLNEAAMEKLVNALRQVYAKTFGAS